jgi:drug/metabolite transporter (DMT)-like permease
MNARSPLIAALMIATTGMMWGLNWPAVKFMLTEFEPVTVRAVAFPCAAVLLFAIAFARGERLRPTLNEFPKLLATGVFVILGFNVMVSLGQTLTETSKAAIIAFTMPAITAVLSVIFLGDRMSVRLLLALAMGMGGLAVLASQDVAALIAAPLGPVFMLLGALSWAIGNVLMKTRDWTLSPIVMAGWFFAISTVFAWPIAFVFESPAAMAFPSPAVVATLAFHVLGPMVLSYILWNMLLASLPVTVAAISTLMVPIVGVSSSIILLGDPLTWHKVVALTMIVASISITLIRPAEAR